MCGPVSICAIRCRSNRDAGGPGPTVVAPTRARHPSKPALRNRSMSDKVWYTRHPLLKSAYKAQKKTRRKLVAQLETVYYRFNMSRSRKRLRHTLGDVDGDYDTYLREQLEETLTKKRLFGARRFDVIPLVAMLASKYDVAGKDVLCVGCRNTDELRYFRRRNVASVVGIDLYDAGPDILIMDMHDLKFADGSFDVVYSRHSFEHAYDTHKVGREFVRVLKDGGVVVIEVPGKLKGGGDYNLFEDVGDVLEAFGAHVDEFLWKEYSRKEDNADKMDIIRVMFHVNKRPVAGEVPAADTAGPVSRHS